MKRFVLIALMAVGIVGAASAQHNDLYFVPKKKKVEQVEEQYEARDKQTVEEKTLSVTAMPVKLLEMDEDAYNRRGSYLTEQGDAVSEFAMDDEGFVLITEEGDTMWMNTDTLRLTRVMDGEGWVNGFDGSDSDYEYAMRIIRFRNPRYAIPVSSPLYWDVVYGGALWPSWEWNIYDDGMYAYVFPTSSNWHYWDYRMSYPLGWNYSYGYPYGYHWGSHWGYYPGYHYGHVWYDPWFNPHFAGYNPGWHHGHHHGHYPHFGAGIPGVGGGGPKAYPNHRTSLGASTRRDAQPSVAPSRGAVGATGGSRVAASSSSSRTSGGAERSSAIRVITDRAGATISAGAVRSSSSSRAGVSDEVIRRSAGSSSVNRSSSSSSRSGGYSSSSSSMSRSSGSTSSYSRPSSTRSSSSSVGGSSSSSSSTRSSSSSSSSRSSYNSSSYSSGSSRSSYSSGSSHSSYSSGSSYSGGSRSGGSYSGGSSSRSTSGSRR